MTITDVAKLAGVSPAAVSRYFNNGYISEEKRQQIEKVVKETGFRPSSSAQQLRSKKTRIIGVVVPKLASDPIAKTVEGMLDVIKDNDYHLMLGVTENDESREIDYIRAIESGNMDGAILFGTIITSEHKKTLKSCKVPVVVIGQEVSGMPCVYYDDYGAIYDVTRYAAAEGRRRLAYIGVTESDKAVGRERLRGFKAAMKKEKLYVDDSMVRIADFTIESGYEQMRELWNQSEDIDAVICATDEIAVGALRFLREKKVSVPKKVLITGQGNSNLVRAAGHDIVTIEYMYKHGGELAVRMLIDRMKGNEETPSGVKLGYEIITKQ